jgi:hypothetical protein
MANPAENTFTIAAGGRSIYEVEKSEDGTNVTIRMAEHPENKFDIMGSAVPDLIKVLQKLAPYK